MSWLADIHAAPRYEDMSYVEELAPGVYRHIQKGGIWNDSQGRAAEGITLADVDGCRADLRATGIRATKAQVDVLLMRLVRGDIDRTPTRPPDLTTGARSAKARSLARAEGFCIICRDREQPDHLPAPGRSTCRPCGIRANEARVRRKALR